VESGRMKEFEEIVDGVAHSLNMTVDSLIKIYPQLRTEYSWYYVLDKINDISENCLLAFGVIMLFACAYIFIEGHSAEKYKTYVKIAICIWVLMAIIYAISLLMKGFMCPDILIIEKFIK
jgi:hypothetical protein